MVIRTIVLALAASVALTGAAVAKGAEIVGFGADACERLTSDANQAEAIEAHYTWAQGYLSGLNGAGAILGERLGDDMLPEGFGPAEQKAFLDAYCRKHPDHPFETAVKKLYFGIRRVTRGLSPELPEAE